MGLDDLAAATKRLRAGNDRLEEELRKDRGSLPPSAPKISAAQVQLTPQRCREIAEIVRGHALLGMFGVTAGEQEAFCVAALATVKGAQPK
jgi:hypothetical protein